ncbi:hypothetical protein KUL49_15160 [Alteromonas sp. KUL49]|nr:hypothetical protein KUL49_15160 [Alteromonas sp. KUL49]
MFIDARILIFAPEAKYLYASQPKTKVEITAAYAAIIKVRVSFEFEKIDSSILTFQFIGSPLHASPNGSHLGRRLAGFNSE